MKNVFLLLFTTLTFQIVQSQTTRIKPSLGHTLDITCIKYSPDNTYIATSSVDKTIKIWSNNLEEIKTLNGHKHPIWDFVLSKDESTPKSLNFQNSFRIA